MISLDDLAKKAKARIGQAYDQVNTVDGGKSYQTRQVSHPTVQLVPAHFIPYADPRQAMQPAVTAPAADTSYSHAVQTVGTQWGLGGLRSLMGLTQGVSGLYDLMTPGTGTNRISHGLDHFAQTTDQTAHAEAAANGISPHGQQALRMAYKGGQLSTDAFSMGVGGEAIEGAIHSVPVLSRLSSMGVHTLRPANAVNVGLQTGLDVGQQASKGHPITLEDILLSGAGNVGLNSGVPATGYGFKQGAQALKPMIRPAVDTVADTAIRTGRKASDAVIGGLNIKPSRAIPDEAVQAASRVREAQLRHSAMDIDPQDLAVYNQLHKVLGSSPNDPTIVDKLISDRRLWQEQGRRQIIKQDNAIRGTR